MGNFIENGSFEDATLDPWNTSGTVTQDVSAIAFEGDNVVTLDPAAGADAIISQQFLLPEGSESIVISYAIRPEVAVVSSGFEARLMWLGSAADGTPIIREDILEAVEPGVLDVVAWQTRAPQTLERPDGAVWGRLRFLAEAGEGGDILLDNVFATGVS